MNILYISPIPVLLPSHEQQLRKVGTLNMIKAEKLSEEAVALLAKDTDVLVLARPSISQCTDAFFALVPRLKFLTTVSTSHDWIDIESAKKRGITVSNCKGANARSVAESTWSLILSLAKRTCEYAEDVKKIGAYKFSEYVGVELRGKTLGIIGLGDIGTEVAQIGHAFGMNIIGYNRSPKNIPDVKQVDLSTLLKESDVISIHVPLTVETNDLITTNEIESMKNGVILINTSDDAIVNKDSVIKSLRQKKLFGYGVETKLMTHIPPLDPYLSFKNVIAYPHNGFNTKEANLHVKDTWVNNVLRFIEGQPQNVVS